MKSDRRYALRKKVEGVQFNDLTIVTSYSILAKCGRIVDASTSGFLIEIERQDLVPEELRKNLSLEATLGQQVALYLPQMNLDLDGTVTRASHVGRGRFVMAVDFSFDVPEYWRACLIDLLPAPGEIDAFEE
jgi:hypothetical protein